MGTVTTKQAPAVVNFLDIGQKKIDWRYLISDSMSNKDTPGQTTIYWIGIIELKGIDENQKRYPLHFITYHHDCKEDREFTRDPDGSQRGIATVLYDLSEILPPLLSAKRMGSQYVHILIEESVDAAGRLTVNALVKKQKTGVNILGGTGFQSHKPWIELETTYTLHLSKIEITSLRRICIRSTCVYNWLK